MDSTVYLSIIKIFVLATLSFIISFSLTPWWLSVLHKYRLGKNLRTESQLLVQMHAAKAGTPTMGGVLIWLPLIILILFFSLIDTYTDSNLGFLNFLSRAETLLPLGVLILAAAAGLVDDYLNVRGKGDQGQGGGMSLSQRLIVYAGVIFIAALWFYFKLDWDLIHVPLLGNYNIGIWYVPVFFFVVFATAFSVNETDGLDGLAGGTLIASFTAFGVISFLQGRLDLAVFCSVIVGALLSFLWFNIHPAKFFMGDTGAMTLGVLLGVVAMLTNYGFLLPIIGFVYLMESASVIIQRLSYKFRNGKRVFKISPIHHHFEAIGWPETKIVMRFWIIGVIATVIGMIIALIDQHGFVIYF